MIDADADPPVLASGIEQLLRGRDDALQHGGASGDRQRLRHQHRGAEPRPLRAARGRGRAGPHADERITVLDGIAMAPVHVNPHIDYGVATGPPSETEESLAQLTDATFSSDGTTLYAAAVGSNRVAVVRRRRARGRDGGARPRRGRARADRGRARRGARPALRHELHRSHHLDRDRRLDSAAARRSAVVAVGTTRRPRWCGTAGHSSTTRANIVGTRRRVVCELSRVRRPRQPAWDSAIRTARSVPNPSDRRPPTPNLPPALPFHPVKGPMTTQSLRGLAPGGSMHWRGDRSAAAIRAATFATRRAPSRSSTRRS